MKEIFKFTKRSSSKNKVQDKFSTERFKALTSEFNIQIRKDTTISVQYFTSGSHQCNERQRKNIKNEKETLILSLPQIMGSYM